jgi:hypothetical protein
MAFNGRMSDLEELTRKVKNKDPDGPTPIQALTASVLLNAYNKGDVNVWNTFLDRFYGKMPIAVLVATNDSNAEVTGTQAKTIVFKVKNGT